MGICNSSKKQKYSGDEDDGNFKLRKTTTLNDNLERIYTKGAVFYNKQEVKLSNDTNPNPAISNNLSEKINLFFKLINHKLNNNSFQLKVQICNNKALKTYSDLDITEAKMGEEIIFDKIFSLDYYFEKEQLLRIIINSPEDSSFQYTVNTTIGTIMGSKNLNFKHEIYSNDTIEFEENSALFDLIIDAKNAKISKEILKININLCFNKNKKNLVKNFDFKEIFLTIANKIDGKNYRKIYKTEELSDRDISLPYDFKEFIIQKELLCEDNSDEVLIKLYDSKLKEFGMVSTSLNKMKDSFKSEAILDLRNNSIIGAMKYTIKESINKSFVDYLAEGLQINLVIGIDFTASNGSPNDKNSLHTIQSNEPNFYERAIQSCGQILSYYDYDKIYPVFGFGAQFLGSNIVNHCFNINMKQDPNINGLENIIYEYHNVIKRLNFSGPTYFTPLIKNVINMIKFNLNNSNENNYYILMILTDGQINDMPQTCDAIVEAALLPLSIIIIGIGSADFTNMNILDGDDDPVVSTTGEIVKRDIVQFVEFRKYEGDAIKLSEQVLEEIPRQVQDYYNLVN